MNATPHDRKNGVVMDWQVDAIQAVVVSLPQQASPDAMQPWLRLFSTSPQQFSSSPPGTPPVSSAAGVIGDFRVTINVSVGRVDLFVGAPQAGEEATFIADLDAALAFVAENVLKIAAEFPMVVRLAMLINSAKPAANAEGAASALRAILPDAGRFIPENALDVDVQFNVRKPGGFKNLAINRLCRWNVGEAQFLKAQPLQALGGNFLVETRYASLFTVDVNNSISDVPLPMEEVSELLHGLISEARALASDGYERLRSVN